MHSPTFPSDFVWGAATAAYQIEGAVDVDGRGPSIWDTFSHTPGKTRNGDTGDVACDHYHRWADDVALMQGLGLRAYRFSVAWPRIFPTGTGAPNPLGLDFYDRLVDGLLTAGITPYLTLYHWDLPQALQEQGGWANRATVAAFVHYAEVVARRLGDRVKQWTTHNEPYVVAFVGNYQGRHAPGLQDLPTAVQVAHHLLVAHGEAVPVIRATVPDAQVGITLDLAPIYPASDRPADALAAERFDGQWNRWFLDPLFGRGYPADLVEFYGSRMPHMEPDDLHISAAPIDFLGINYYRPAFVSALPEAEEALGIRVQSGDELRAAGYEVTEMGWPVVAEELHTLLRRVHHDYAPPAIYITENGAAYPDTLTDGVVHDPQRRAYLHDHLAACAQAIDDGVPLKGYFVWSLMDNFEWGLGYSKTFGIVHTDYQTQRRTPKASAEWYRRAIAANAVVPVEGQGDAADGVEAGQG